MQNMIKRIIEMDKQARALNDDAQERRDGAAQAVEQKKEEVRRNYLALAQQRIDVIREAETQDARERMDEITRHNGEVIARMEQTVERERDRWVAEIVERVTKGDDPA